MTFRLLIIGWLTSILARVFLFGGGGEVGAYVSVAVFWVTTAALIGLSAWRLVNKREKHALPYLLVLIALVAFSYRLVVTDGSTASVSAMLFLACVVGLVVVYVKRKLSRSNAQL